MVWLGIAMLGGSMFALGAMVSWYVYLLPGLRSCAGTCRQGATYPASSTEGPLMIHVVGRSRELGAGVWECDALCGRSVPEGLPINLDDAGDRLCPDCRNVYDVQRRESIPYVGEVTDVDGFRYRIDAVTVTPIHKVQG